MIEVAEEADGNDPGEDEPPEELYTTLNTNVVGVQYYEGCVSQKLCRTCRTNASSRPRWVRRTGETRPGTK